MQKLSKLLIICLIIAVFIPQLGSLPQAHAEEAADLTETFIINDFDIGDGLNKFKYYGNWGTTSGNAGAGNYNNDEHWSNSGSWSNPADNYFTIKFEGEQIKLFAIKDPNHGIYAVSIDNGPEILVDAYSSTRQFKQLIFDSGLLTQGEHTLKLRATGQKTGGRPDIQIDYAEVTKRMIAVTGISMNTDKLTISEGDLTLAEAQALPTNASNQNIIWSSSDPSIVTVNASGLLAAISAGVVQLTATTEDGGFSVSREVEVTAGGNLLKGAVGTTDMHYVKENLFDDYKRIDYHQIIQMNERTWNGTAWKGDRASGQFVLWTTTGAEENLNLSIQNFTNGNHTIDSSNIEVNFVKTTKAARGNPSLGRPQEDIPDIIYSSDPVDMEPYSVQNIWLSVDVPVDAAPGVYANTLTVTADSGDQVSFDLQLEVLDIAMPDQEDWDFFLDLWQNPFAVARVNGITANQLWTEAHFDAMRPHYEMLAEAGQTVITTTVTYDPWNSQTYDRYESMVHWTKHTDGTYSFDFTIFDKWVEFMMSLGIDQQIDAYSMVSWASKIKYYDEATQQDIIATVNVGTQQWTTMWTAFLEAFVPHLEEKGWLDITYMANDERSINDLIIAANLIDEVSDHRLKVSAAMNYNSLNDSRLDRIHNISIGLHYIVHDSNQLIQISQRRRDLGLTTTIYNCVGHYPNSFTRSNPAEPTWVMWYTLRHQTDGYLRWAFDSFVQDPYVTTDFRSWESGDTAQVYPGARSSIRFEKLKEGIRDVVKARHLSSLDTDIKSELDAAIQAMQKTGHATDPYGGVRDPGIVDIPAEVSRLQNALLNATRSYIENQQPPEIPQQLSLNVNAPASIQEGSSFTALVGLQHVSDSIMAQDLWITYNSELVSLDSITETTNGVQIISSNTSSPGEAHIILSSLGIDQAITTDEQFLSLRFTALETLNSQLAGQLSITVDGIAANELGEEIELHGATVTVNILPRDSSSVPGDLNGDQRVTIGDLAIIAAHYGKTKETAADWDDIKHIDVNNDEEINLDDLVFVANKLLSVQ